MIHYLAFDLWREIGDPRISHLPLVSSPWPTVAIVAAYLVFVKFVGPRWMRNREPFQLKGLILMHNITLVVINLIGFWWLLGVTDYALDIFTEHKFPLVTDNSPKRLRRITFGYFYLGTKVLDLLDTVFFVLRKRYNHVTFLHVYHHSLMPFMVWFTLYTAPTFAYVGILPLLNCPVHIIMYSYYALASFGPKMRPYLWWKRYVTQIQLVQFVLMGILSITLFIRTTAMPDALRSVYHYLLLPQPVIFFALFYAFYNTSYKSITKKNDDINNNNHK